MTQRSGPVGPERELLAISEPLRPIGAKLTRRPLWGAEVAAKAVSNIAAPAQPGTLGLLDKLGEANLLTRIAGAALEAGGPLGPANSPQWLSHSLGFDVKTFGAMAAHMKSSDVALKSLGLAASLSSVGSSWSSMLGPSIASLDAFARTLSSSKISAPDLTKILGLSARRSLLEVSTPITANVDRIARGWISLIRQVGQGRTSMMPYVAAATHLTEQAYELDLSTSGLIDEVKKPDREPRSLTGIESMLAKIDPRCAQHWAGMVDTVERRGPDWQVHASCSAVELVDKLLNAIARPELVLDWRQQLGLYGDELQSSGRPRRSLQMKYLAHVYSFTKVTVDALFVHVPKIIAKLQNIKHTSASDGDLLESIGLIREVVSILVVASD